MELRCYQKKTINLITQYFRQLQSALCVVLPTGSGKSHIIAELCRKASEKNKDCRILMLTHSSELVKQKIGAAADAASMNDSFKETWLLFLPENEFHEIGLIFAKFLLINSGHEVVYLGANVPYGSLLQLAEKKHIDNVLFFSVSNTSKSNLDFTINYLEKSFPKSTHYLVANSLDINFLTKSHKITILDNLDDFVGIID